MNVAERAKRLYEALCYQPPEAWLKTIERHLEEAIEDGKEDIQQRGGADRTPGREM